MLNSSSQPKLPSILAGPELLHPERSRRVPRRRPAGRLDEARTAVYGPAKFMSICTAELARNVSHTKQNTSQFLIDNFGAHILQRPPQRRIADAYRTSNLEPPTSSPNRPSPRLEMPVSHRKQTAGPISNRPQIAFSNSRYFRAPSSASPTSNLEPLSSRILIANETHSRRESCGCKHSTYEILIANEFHISMLPRDALLGSRLLRLLAFRATKSWFLHNRSRLWTEQRVARTLIVPATCAQPFEEVFP